ncbi:MAG: hypothetical protein ABJA74_08415 [Lapillicoccus sp.]
MKAWRIGFATAGILLGLFGAVQLVTQVPVGSLIGLALWMIAAVVIHDGILSPLVVGVGWFLSQRVPARARRYLQGGLVAGGLITVVALPLIVRSRTANEPASKALLQQDFGGNLTVLLGIAAAVSLVFYAARVARDARTEAQPVDRPPEASR